MDGKSGCIEGSREGGKMSRNLSYSLKEMERKSRARRGGEEVESGSCRKRRVSQSASLREMSTPVNKIHPS